MSLCKKQREGHFLDISSGFETDVSVSLSHPDAGRSSTGVVTSSDCGPLIVAPVFLSVKFPLQPFSSELPVHHRSEAFFVPVCTMHSLHLWPLLGLQNALSLISGNVSPLPLDISPGRLPKPISIMQPLTCYISLEACAFLSEPAACPPQGRVICAKLF